MDALDLPTQWQATWAHSCLFGSLFEGRFGRAAGAVFNNIEYRTYWYQIWPLLLINNSMVVTVLIDILSNDIVNY